LQNPSFDFVADLPYRLDPLPLWIWQRPIGTPEARNIGAFIAASHRDEHLSVLSEFGGEFLRL
jgi:hypothetical protein